MLVVGQRWWWCTWRHVDKSKIYLGSNVERSLWWIGAIKFWEWPEVSIFTMEWLVVPQPELENPRTKFYWGKKDDEFNFNLLSSMVLSQCVHCVRFLSLSGPWNCSYMARVLIILPDALVTSWGTLPLTTVARVKHTKAESETKLPEDQTKWRAERGSLHTWLTRVCTTHLFSRSRGVWVLRNHTKK